MAEDRTTGGRTTSDAVARAHAIYTPLTLSLYDGLVHGLSNRFVWRCPTQALLRLYADNLSTNHLEAGVGTGSLIDRAGNVDVQRLVLLDINRNCLAAAQRRLARFRPQVLEASVLDPSRAGLLPSTLSALPMCCTACQGACPRSYAPSTICGR